MYVVSFTNFDYTKDFKCLDTAIEHMKCVGFESVLLEPTGREVAHFSPITGFHWRG